MNKLKQTTSLTQRKVLSQQTRQAIKLLQLNSIDLMKEIDNLLLENPLLEKEDAFDIQSEYDVLPLAGSPKLDDTDILDYHQQTETLREYLLKQLDTSSLSDVEKNIAYIIIDCVDDNGYLTEDLNSIFIQSNKITETSFQDIFYILHTLQRFDPIGTCCVDLCDTLKIQLEYHYKESVLFDDALKIIDSIRNVNAKDNAHFQNIVNQITSKDDTKNEAFTIIKSLNPKPGLEISAKIDSYQITPDVIIFKRGDKWITELTRNTPNVKINKEYFSMMKDIKLGVDKDFLEKNYQQAKFIIKSLKNRNITILNVCEEIFKKQSEFLKQGQIGISPMTLKEIGDKLGVHESTVSRATNNKYVQTPRGVYELKYFFSSELNTDTGNVVSSKAIISMIDDIIKKENKISPLSDSDISNYFKEKGITVARRTIAKYRELLNLPNSSHRKIKQ